MVLAERNYAMIGMGTVVNAAAILAGAALGLVLRQGLPDRWQETIMHAIGLSVTVIGIQMAMKTNNIIIVIISLVAGAIIGEYFDIDKTRICLNKPYLLCRCNGNCWQHSGRFDRRCLYALCQVDT